MIFLDYRNDGTKLKINEMEKLTVTKRPIKVQDLIDKDLQKVSLWKRDTEKVIALLKKRKDELCNQKNGTWEKYLEGVGMPKTTAFNLLKEVKEIAQIDKVPNGTLSSPEPVL